MQALMAATGRAAECMGLQDEIGTIEPGKMADLILVEGDPLEDVSILEKGSAVVFVMKGGTVHVDKRSA